MAQSEKYNNIIGIEILVNVLLILIRVIFEIYPRKKMERDCLVI